MRNKILIVFGALVLIVIGIALANIVPGLHKSSARPTVVTTQSSDLAICKGALRSSLQYHISHPDALAETGPPIECATIPSWEVEKLATEVMAGQ